MSMNRDFFSTLATDMDVLDAGGEKVGKIIEVRDSAILVEKGFFLPKDYLVPLSLIDRIDEDGRVLLNVSKDSLNEDVLNESSDADLELAGSTTFDPTIAASIGLMPQQAGIDVEDVIGDRDGQPAQ
jgi:hypothetical protein